MIKPTPKIAMYSHDTMGLGHVRRNLLIAQTLAAKMNATVLMISGAWEAGLFSLPQNVDCVTLPALEKSEDGTYSPRRLGVSLRQIVAMRAQMILAAVKSFAPDVMIVDKVPRGVCGELEPTLVQLEETRFTRLVLGLRDILDEPEALRREWETQKNEDAIRRFYDAVWIYGDRKVYDPIREYRLSAEVGRKVQFAGYLNRRAQRAPEAADILAELRLPAGELALCLTGGGQDGMYLAEAFANAFANGHAPAMNGLILTGPFMPQAARQRLHHMAANSARLRVLEFVSDASSLVAAADRLVIMGGYNTVCEALSFDKPTLVVPRITPRLEQLVRAQRLAEMRLLEMLHPLELSGEKVAQWLGKVPSPRERASCLIDFGGLERLDAMVSALMPPPDIQATVRPQPAVSHVL
jgi:predicted glycosyltransferase